MRCLVLDYFFYSIIGIQEFDKPFLENIHKGNSEYILFRFYTGPIGKGRTYTGFQILNQDLQSFTSESFPPWNERYMRHAQAISCLPVTPAAICSLNQNHDGLLIKDRKQHVLHVLFRFPSKSRTLPLLFGIMRLILFEIVVILFLKNRKVGAAV